VSADMHTLKELSSSSQYKRQPKFLFPSLSDIRFHVNREFSVKLLRLARETKCLCKGV
jgi:hypothetical protein